MSFITFSALSVISSLPDVRRGVAVMENITLIWMSVKSASHTALGKYVYTYACICAKLGIN